MILLSIGVNRGRRKMAKIFYRSHRSFAGFTEKTGGLFRFGRNEYNIIMKIDFRGKEHSQIVITLLKEEMERLLQYYKAVKKFKNGKSGGEAGDEKT